jgi:TPP-dependent 2-oxoacid decarboxylase
MAESEILVGQYLFRRLKELGIQTVFGVPGGVWLLPSLNWSIVQYCA